MIICRSFDDLRGITQPIHWAIGCFDGVHCGHRRVIESANTPGALRGVLTFEPHPLAVLRPEIQPDLLTPLLRQKADLMESLCGVDVLLVLPFTPTLASMSPQFFLDSLGCACRIAGVSVGENWHFGHGGAGNPDMLRCEGERRGFRVCVSPLEKDADGVVSSRRVRAVLASGNMDKVECLLGHPFTIAGEVEQGQHLARRLGFPTANLPIPPHAALPPAGVYGVRCCVQGQCLRGIANLGLRPSIAEQRKRPRLEVHFPGWNGDLYGCFLSVQIESFLRPEKKFPTLDALREQIAKDIERYDV